MKRTIYQSIDDDCNRRAIYVLVWCSNLIKNNFINNLLFSLNFVIVSKRDEKCTLQLALHTYLHIEILPCLPIPMLFMKNSAKITEIPIGFLKFLHCSCYYESSASLNQDKQPIHFHL